MTTASGETGTPTVSTSITNEGPCGSPDPNELQIAFETSNWFTTSGSVVITVSDVRYDVGATASAVGVGAVTVSASYLSTAVTATNAANAFVGGISVSADTPAVTLVPSAYDAPVSPVDVVESTSAHLQPGYVCVTADTGAFDESSVPAVQVLDGDGAVAPAVTFQESSATGPTAVAFEITAASTTPATYGLSHLAVDAPATSGPVVVRVTEGTSATCADDTGDIGSATAYKVANTAVTRIYGETADETAAAELEHQFGATGTNCPGRAGARPVVLATDATYPDALASAYLASALGTGELLTSPGTLSSAAANAIRVEGITDVYVVGGPLAVSDAVVQQLESTVAYDCGGLTPATSAQPVHLSVTRIWGQTEYDTAQWIAEYPNVADVGTVDVAGAYQGTDATGGDGRYNDTAGHGSAAPATATTLPTAILATGQGFQDAESASALSYAEHLPILLTTPGSLSPQAASAIGDLEIKQVVVMGGPLAVSDAVVTALENLGVTVLRVAGKDDTDTAVQLADLELGATAGRDGLGWAGTGGVTVARGDFYTDGLAGALVAAGAGRTATHGAEPLLLTDSPTSVGSYLTAFLEEAGKTGIDGDAADRVSSITVLGGPLAVSPAALSSMTGDL